MNISLLKKAIKNSKILVIGDIILDVGYHGSVHRLAQEAPIPILNHEKTLYSLGGAGNVCANINALGAKSHLLSLCGDDSAYDIIVSLLQKHHIDYKLIKDKARITTQKHRYYTQNHQLLRMDKEMIKEACSIIIEQMQEFLINLNIVQYQAIIISDYGKGCITHEFCQWVISLAHQYNIPVIVDPIGHDYQKYSFADYITPNVKELSLTAKKSLTNFKEQQEQAYYICQQYHIHHVLLTRSEHGIALISQDLTCQFPTIAQEIFDVTGAGDTVVACFASMLSAGIPTLLSVQFSNSAGGVVVAKYGAATSCFDELYDLYKYTTTYHTSIVMKDHVSRETLFYHNDEQFKLFYDSWRQNHKICFTNGCFDLFHDGHKALLQHASLHNAKIIIGLNSDVSVKILKGSSRPIMNQYERMSLLLGLEIVDAVIIFDEETPLKLIELLQPDILLKGGDYTKDSIVGADLVEKNKGVIDIFPLESIYSTSSIIDEWSQNDL